MEAAKSGSWGIHARESAWSADAAKRRSAFRRGRRCRRDLAGRVRTFARCARPRPSQLLLRWLRVRRRSICGVTVCGLLDWSCALLMRQGLPADHCAHAAAESGKKNHPDMDEKEEQQSQRDEEVKRARGL